MKMNVLPCKIFSLLLFQTKYFQFVRFCPLSRAACTQTSCLNKIKEAVFPLIKLVRRSTAEIFFCSSLKNLSGPVEHFEKFWEYKKDSQAVWKRIKVFINIVFCAIPKSQKIPGSGFKSNPGIPGFFGIPLDTACDPRLVASYKHWLYILYIRYGWNFVPDEQTNKAIQGVRYKNCNRLDFDLFVYFLDRSNIE